MVNELYTVVLETSVIVAALRSRRGASAELLRLLTAGAYSAAISATLVFEYEEILVRELVPEFLSLDDVDQFIRFICQIGQKHQPMTKLRPAVADPDDEFLVELAVAARVEYVVTHNRRHLAGAEAFGITVVTPGRFLWILREQP